MVSVDATIREHNEHQLKEFEANVAKVIDNFQSQYNKYNSQHMEYVRYVEAQIKSIENARQAAVSDPGPGSGIGPPPGPMANFPGSGRLDSPSMMRGCPPGFGRPVNPMYPHPYSPRMPMMCDLMQMPRMYPGPNGRPYYPRAYNGPVPNCPPANGRPPWPRNGMGMPPFSGPPPSQGPSGPSWGYDRPRMPFRPAGVDPRAIPFIPRVTVRMNYFNSPAGLMLPLVRLEDHKYKVLDPECLRVPRPTVPQESLLAAVEAFYSKPNHEAPRDSEGWEKLGLYEYYRAKNIAIRQKRSLDSDTKDSANEDRARKHGRSSAGDTSSSSELDDASDVST